MLPSPIQYTFKIFRLASSFIQNKKCHSLFNIKEIIQKEKPETFSIVPVQSKDHEMAIDTIKKHYLCEHVLVRERKMHFSDDRAIDEYLLGLIKQGNALFAKTKDDSVAGLCINFAVSPVDPQNLRTYAFYRQDPKTKDFLYFTAKLQETPNLWTMFGEQKIFEIKMLTVLPEYRRQGLGVLLAEKSKMLALDQGYKVIRMDCINRYDYKIAEHCMMSCLARFPLHKLRGANAPFIKRSSEYNKYIRVYVTSTKLTDIDQSAVDMESMSKYFF